MGENLGMRGGAQAARANAAVLASREGVANPLTALQGRAFDSRPLRTVLAVLAVLLFHDPLALLTTIPICHE